MQDNKRIEKEKKYWDKLSPKYDRFIEKYWKIYASSLLNKIADDVDTGISVLEVACGTGLIALEVAKKAKKVYGIDIAPSMINEAKRKLKQKEIENVEFFVEDAYKLHFDRNSFQDLFLNEKIYGEIEDLLNIIRNWGIEEVHFTDTGDLVEIPRFLRVPWMLGNIGIIYGKKIKGGNHETYRKENIFYLCFTWLTVFHIQANLLCL